MRYISKFWFFSCAYVREHAHTLIAREFVDGLSDKIDFIVDVFLFFCYFVVVFLTESIMYLKDKNQRITLRLTAEQFEFVRGSAEALGVSPSDFLRMVINFTMTTSKKADEAVNKVVHEMEGMRRENEQANINNIV